jgi:peptidoglycan/LPS O-acetylase OafA/YrhL
MLEITRFVLAAVVAQTHLVPLHDQWLGQQAVFAFYTLSGYLMTRVLNTRYGFSAAGTKAFILNRILRLWPAYLVVLGLTLIASLEFPLGPNRVPHSLIDALTSLTILGQTKFDFLTQSDALPVLTSWSLSIELVSYILLAVYFARSKKRLFVFAALGVIAIGVSTIHCAVGPDPARYGPFCYQNRYGVIQAGFIPFAAGGLVYFYFDALSDWVTRNTTTVLATLLLLEILCVGSAFVAINFATYIGIGAMALIILSRANDPLTKTTDFFGRASYHLFISHMSIAPVLAALWVGRRSPLVIVAIFVLTVLLSLGLSIVLVPLELKINRLRRRISGWQDGRSDDHSAALARQPRGMPSAKPIDLAALNAIPPQAMVEELRGEHRQ